MIDLDLDNGSNKNVAMCIKDTYGVLSIVDLRPYLPKALSLNSPKYLSTGPLPPTSLQNRPLPATNPSTPQLPTLQNPIVNLYQLQPNQVQSQSNSITV